MKLRILFLCTHNSCRSQMAEGLLRFRYGGTFESFSAGTEPSSVNPYAIEVMDELGVDLSMHSSQHLSRYLDQPFDAVVTTCDSAQGTCPIFPGAKRTMHRSFVDPSDAVGSDEEILAVFRSVRDQIDQWIQDTFEPRTFGTRSKTRQEGDRRTT